MGSRDVTHYAGERIGCFVIPIGASMTAGKVEYMLNPGSTVLLCTPPLPSTLRESERTGRLSRAVVAAPAGEASGGGGTETQATRRKIEEGLAIDAYDYYGLAKSAPPLHRNARPKRGCILPRINT